MAVRRIVLGGLGLTVTVHGLPFGYSARVGAIVSTSAPDSGVVELLLTSSPVTDPVEIVTGEGKLADSFVPEEGPEVNGGDVFLYTTPTAEWLYERLSGTMRARDESGPGALQQLTRVLGGGLTEARDSADNIVDLIDIDTCPAEFLPHMAALLGFDFPYDLEETLQRNFIRSIVALYRVKGTPLALSFVVNRIIAGKGFRLEITNEDHLAKTFDVRLNAEDTAEGSDALQAKVSYLVGIYSPAGLTPSIIVVFFYLDQQDATRQSDVHTTIAHTRWSYNQPGHAYNKFSAAGAVAYTTIGQQTLSI